MTKLSKRQVAKLAAKIARDLRSCPNAADSRKRRSMAASAAQHLADGAAVVELACSADKRTALRYRRNALK